MKVRRVQLEHRAVPQGYEPGYPAELSPGEYRELLLATTHSRAARLALAAGLLAGCSARTEDSTPASREARVLELLHDLHGSAQKSWYRETTFSNSGDAARHVIVPSIPISFGNSHNGVFDAARARELARELLEIYGLAPLVNVRVEVEGGAAVLDAFDAERKFGVELRGTVPTPNHMFAQAVDEPAAAMLDESEREALERQGLRLHVADLDAYPLMDGDQFTPTLAYLAGIVSFLNEVTEGPDIDLSAILVRAARRILLPSLGTLELPAGVTASELHGLLHTLRAERPATVRLPFGVEDTPRPLPGREQQPLSTSRTPTVLELTVAYDAQGLGAPPETSPLSIRLLQGEIDVRSSSEVVFAPASFDATRPFVLELSLAPGVHTFWSTHHLVGASAR